MKITAHLGKISLILGILFLAILFLEPFGQSDLMTFISFAGLVIGFLLGIWAVIRKQYISGILGTLVNLASILFLVMLVGLFSIAAGVSGGQTEAPIINDQGVQAMQSLNADAPGAVPPPPPPPPAKPDGTNLADTSGDMPQPAPTVSMEAAMLGDMQGEVAAAPPPPPMPDGMSLPSENKTASSDAVEAIDVADEKVTQLAENSADLALENTQDAANQLSETATEATSEAANKVAGAADATANTVKETATSAASAIDDAVETLPSLIIPDESIVGSVADAPPPPDAPAPPPISADTAAQNAEDSSSKLDTDEAASQLSADMTASASDASPAPLEDSPLSSSAPPASVAATTAQIDFSLIYKAPIGFERVDEPLNMPVAELLGVDIFQKADSGAAIWQTVKAKAPGQNVQAFIQEHILNQPGPAGMPFKTIMGEPINISGNGGGADTMQYVTIYTGDGNIKPETLALYETDSHIAILGLSAPTAAALKALWAPYMRSALNLQFNIKQ